MVLFLPLESGEGGERGLGFCALLVNKFLMWSNENYIFLIPTSIFKNINLFFKIIILIILISKKTTQQFVLPIHTRQARVVVPCTAPTPALARPIWQIARADPAWTLALLMSRRGMAQGRWAPGENWWPQEWPIFMGGGRNFKKNFF